MNQISTTNSDLSLQEVAELLAEVRHETHSCPDSNLFDFAGLLTDLIRLHQTKNANDSQVELASLADFIAKGTDEVRSVLEADTPSFERVNALCQEAIDRWGELLSEISDQDESLSDQAWTGSLKLQGESAGESNTGDLDSLDVPSADAIEAMLSQLVAEAQIDVVDQSTDLSIAGNEVLEPTAESIVGIESLDPELREAFMDDASSCLSSMENALLKLESNLRDAESLNQILRELHTLKGASGSVGLIALADQLHQLEDTLREDQAAGREPSIDQLLSTVEKIRGSIGGNNLTDTISEETSTRQPQRSDNSPAHVATPTFSEDKNDDELVRVKSSQLNRLMDMLVELVMLRNQRETELSELQGGYHELISSVSKMRILSSESELRASTCTSLQLSEVANDVLEAAQHIRDCARPFADGNAAVSRFIRQFRQELVELRRTPISGLFRRLQLVARDAARAESKQVRLTLLGEDAGIERSLQQRLYEPLLHIVRNSVGHGIESSEERMKNGKEPEGVISIEAKSGPNLFVIEIRDDGRGLNYEAIRRRGVERGLIEADQIVNRDELSMLIFNPGFSTRDSANQVGGRGVGMDVVAATMQRMRGWLEVTSEPGAGTRIQLSFPLPSVIQHAMVFRCNDQLFALPMESVQAAGKASTGVPSANFSRLLGFDGPAAQTSETIVIADDKDATMHGKAVPLALFVDEIIGPEELVVRPLPSLLKHHPFCAGATLSGMGQTVILLDARRLLRSQAAPLSTALQQHQQSVAAGKPQPAPKRARVLVVDDSLSARKRVVRSLARYPLEVVEACDGKEALAQINKQRFTAIFSDMEMPNIDGMELLSQIHGRDRSNPPPVVIISSRSETEFTERAKMLGAANYLIKPLTDEALDDALRCLPPLSHLLRDKTLANLENSI